jgi:hypothetical protein
MHSREANHQLVSMHGSKSHPVASTSILVYLRIWRSLCADSENKITGNNHDRSFRAVQNDTEDSKRSEFAKPAVTWPRDLMYA